MIWHMRKIVPRPEILLLTRKICINEKANLTEMFKKTSKIVCRVHQPLWYLLTHCLLLHQLLQLWRLQKTQKRTLMTVNQQMKEISKWSFTGRIAAVTKKIPARTWVSEVTVSSDTPEYWINWHLCISHVIWINRILLCCLWTANCHLVSQSRY